MTLHKFKVAHENGRDSFDAERLECVNNGLGITLFIGDAVVAHFPRIEYVSVEYSRPPQPSVKPVEPLEGAVTVDLLPGEVLEFISPLSAAIESTVRVLECAKDDAKEALSVHLNGLLAEQRSQLFTSPRPVRDQIGTV